MRIMTNSRLRTGVAAIALGASLALAGCNRASQLTEADNASASYSLPDLPATLPLSAGEARPINYAPDADQLPDTAPVRAVRVADPGQRYAYADSAYGFADALGDAPPDYAFDYDGVDPWAWQGYDDSTVFAEPLDDGYRYYYYRAGYDEPYFIRDPYYGYGFDGGQLAVVYAADGGIVPWADYGPRVVYASRYLVRGRDLWRASRNRRFAVTAANWTARAPVIFRSRRAWNEAALRQPGWASYRQANFVRQQRHWQPEAIRRQADARRFAAWRARDFRTPPPPRAIPAAWQRASWARDERRFAPVRLDRQQQLAQQRAEQRADRLADARRDRIADARGPGRQALIAQRQENRAARQQQAQRQDMREQRRDLAQQRQQRADQAQDRQRQAAQRQQAQQARQQARQQQAERQQARQAQAGERAQRRQAQAARQQAQQAREERQRAQAGRQQAQQARAERQQAQAAQAAQRQQAQQARAERQSQAAQRQQAQQARAERQQAQAAQNAQRQQAQQARAERQQAQQAQAAQRQQAQQAQAAQRQQAQQMQAGRAEMRQQRQEMRQQRQEMRAERGPGRDR